MLATYATKGPRTTVDLVTPIVVGSLGIDSGQRRLCCSNLPRGYDWEGWLFGKRSRCGGHVGRLWDIWLNVNNVVGNRDLQGQRPG